MVVTVALASGGPASGGGRKILLVYFGIINARDQFALVSVKNDSFREMLVLIQTVKINWDYSFVMLARISSQIGVAPSLVNDE